MSEWRSQPLYAVATEVRETVDPAVFGEVEVEHYSIPALDATGLPEVVPASEILSGKQRLRGGELMVSRLNPRKARVLEVPPLGQRVALASGEFVVMRPTAIDPRFLRYVLLAESTRQALDSMVQSVTRSHQRIRPEHLMKLPVPVPGRPQQGAIADYLDAETARIDALITMKRRLVDLLGQWRFATLQRVLCPGQTVSGYLQAERLGDAGAVQLKRLLQRTIAGGTPASDNSDFWAEPDDEGAHPWLAIGDMVDRGVTRSTAKALSREGLQACRLQPAPPGVLLFAMYASLGKLTITGGPAVWNQAIVGLVPAGDRALTKYLAYWLELIRPYLASLARSTTQDNLNAEQVGDLPVRAVPLAEQAAMVDRLDEAFAALATTAAGLADQIGLLVERRQALITAVVTGELAVPGAV